MGEKNYEDTKMKTIVPVIMLGTKSPNGNPNYMICAGKLDGISGAYMSIHKAKFDGTIDFGQEVNDPGTVIDKPELLSVINFATIESVDRMIEFLEKLKERYYIISSDNDAIDEGDDAELHHHTAKECWNVLHRKIQDADGDMYIRAKRAFELLEIEENGGKLVAERHGRWDGNDRHKWCTMCNATYCIRDGEDGVMDMSDYRFCPNCGARMDGCNYEDR